MALDPLVDSFPLLVTHSILQWTATTLIKRFSNSGLGTSLSEASPDLCDNACGGGSWSAGEESRNRLKVWLTGTGCPEDEEGHLSTVEEGREKESSQSCSSSPEHTVNNGNLEPSTDINQTDQASSQLESAESALPTSDSPLDAIYSPDLDVRNKDNINNNINMGNSLDNVTSTKVDDVEVIPTTPNKTDAIGEIIDVVAYSRREWQGNTTKAHTIREGYMAIPSTLGLSHIRRIRGDNYCAIRATLFQILSAGISLPSGYQVYNRLSNEYNSHNGGSSCSWLHEYSFGKRLTFSKDRLLEGFKECLDALDSMSSELDSCENRAEEVAKRFKTDSKLEVRLCEAVKLHMLSSALDLFSCVEEGGNAPLFALIMYARQSCADPKELMLNHLNLVGDSAGLEQVEMFLLGHALQVTLRVARPGCYGSEDFISFYPDSNIGCCPEITLIAEDDRHYNVLVD